MNSEIERFIRDQFKSIPDFNSIVFYSSKKNSVSKVNDIILKYFIWGSIQKEIQINKLCFENDIKVPRILKVSKNIIAYEYIKESKSTDLECKISNIMKWLKKFHEKTGLCKGDQRIHNYIFSNNVIYGIDFEETYSGDVLEDLSSLIVSLSKMFDLKKLSFFLKDYSKEIKIEDLIPYFDNEIKIRKKWGEQVNRFY